MSDDAYLLDTNVLIDYLDGSIPAENHRIDAIFRDSFVISVITKIEFLGWSGFLDSQDESASAHDFISHAHVVPLLDEIANRVIEFRQRHTIPLADGVIAATALHREATLVTRNISDFESIPSLRLHDPHKVEANE